MLPSGGSHVLRSLSVLLALHAVFLWAVPAQERELPGAEPQVGCFRGRPLPECKSIWIVEMQAATPLAQTSRTIQYPDASEDRREEFVRVLQWNLGHMVNVGDDWGIGGVVTLGTNTERWLSGLEARIRRWVNPHLSIEAEGGALLSNGTSGGKGATAALRFNVRDQGSIYLRWDMLRIPELTSDSGVFDPGGTQHGLSFGVGVGSLPALVGTGVLGIGALVLTALILGLAGGTS